MDLMQAIEERHAVRSYRDKPLSHEAVAHLEAVIARCNAEGSLRFQLVRECPSAFSWLASYGMFKGVRDCIAFVGRQEDGLEEKIGYYGELIALEAQRADLNSCWVALTYRKKHLKARIRTRRNVSLRPSDWIRRQSRKTPRHQIAREALPLRRESCTWLVHRRGPCRTACTDRHEPTALLHRAERKNRAHIIAWRPLHRHRPWHRETSFRNRRTKRPALVALGVNA